VGAMRRNWPSWWTCGGGCVTCLWIERLRVCERRGGGREERKEGGHDVCMKGMEWLVLRDDECLAMINCDITIFKG
jgi:hypothetical protein